MSELPDSPWDHCLKYLEEYLPQQQFNTWIRPLHAKVYDSSILLLAPNQFVRDWVRKNYMEKITTILTEKTSFGHYSLSLEIGSQSKSQADDQLNAAVVKKPPYVKTSNLNPDFTFKSFVSGKSNQLAKAACIHISENPGGSYNPLFIYGGVGLGKTHLLHAIGHAIEQNRGTHIIYLHSEHFVNNMVKALQHNTINDFKRFYRLADVLLIDDIQFFARKERSQEEFFHTFNTLLEGQRQIVLTCDRYPKEVSGLEDRLKSRFGWGLTVAVESPELETRVAIVKSKAIKTSSVVPDDVAFFIAQRFHSNVRELEGALNRVIANANLTHQTITIEMARESLRDLLLLQDKLVTIENIQKVTAGYYNIRVSDLLSKRRNRSITRPRQMAMKLSKELTNNSLPEIGNAFGGRDHSTVLHACRKVDELMMRDTMITNDYNNLSKTLTA